MMMCANCQQVALPANIKAQHWNGPMETHINGPYK